MKLFRCDICGRHGGEQFGHEGVYPVELHYVVTEIKDDETANRDSILELKYDFCKSCVFVFKKVLMGAVDAVSETRIEPIQNTAGPN